MGENEKKVVDIIITNKSVTHLDLAAKLKLSATAVWKIVAKLKKKGLLRRIGPDKDGYREVMAS